jgi:hypothetical protein
MTYSLTIITISFIQIQKWIDALTDLEKKIIFGRPNMKMDRCEEKLVYLLSFLDVQIQKWTAILE